MLQAATNALQDHLAARLQLQSQALECNIQLHMSWHLTVKPCCIIRPKAWATTIATE